MAKAYFLIPTTTGCYCGGNSYQLSLYIDQMPREVARVNRRIRLNKVFITDDSDVGTARSTYSPCHGAVKPERIADCQNYLADAELRGITERYGWQAGGRSEARRRFSSARSYLPSWNRPSPASPEGATADRAPPRGGCTRGLLPPGCRDRPACIPGNSASSHSWDRRPDLAKRLFRHHISSALIDRALHQDCVLPSGLLRRDRWLC